MQRTHAKLCAARYPPHCAGPPAHVGGHDRLLSQPTFDAAADCYKGTPSPKQPLRLRRIRNLFINLHQLWKLSL